MTTEPIFNGQKAFKIEKTVEESNAKKRKQRKRTKKPNKDQSRLPTLKDGTTNSQKSENPCQVCGVKNHRFRKCYLVKGENKKKSWIIMKACTTFKNNIKTFIFKDQVIKYKLELQQKQQQSANE